VLPTDNGSKVAGVVEKLAARLCAIPPYTVNMRLHPTRPTNCISANVGHNYLENVRVPDLNIVKGGGIVVNPSSPMRSRAVRRISMLEGRAGGITFQSVASLARLMPLRIRRIAGILIAAAASGCRCAAR
jgi:hypothetical protein